MRRLGRLIGVWLRPHRLDDDLAAELEDHRLRKQEALERMGMPSEEAAYAARRALGNVTLAREDARRVWIRSWFESVGQDARYAIRALIRQPGFAAVAIGTLATAIGLNTTVFDIYCSLTLRPWPAADAHRLVTIYSLSERDLRTRAGGGPQGFSQAEVRYFAEHSRSVSGFIAMRSGGGDRTLGDDDIPAAWVSASYFSVLGIEMAAGRGFVPEEDRLESPTAVAVLSHGYWQRQFGGDLAANGRTILLEGVSFTVVGIAPPGFAGTSTERVDIWMPIASATLLRPDDRWVLNVASRAENCCLSLAGRLAPGATREQALAELSVLDRRFRGGRDPDAGRIRIAGTNGRGSDAFPSVFAGVVLVLILACANVGNLLIARAAARRREIGVRLSLGASRGRIVRQLLTESLALAILAGAVGLLIAAWLSSRVVSLLFGPTRLGFQLDGGVLGYALVLSLASCLVFGLAPALHGTRSGIRNALRDGLMVARSQGSLRSLLLAVQVSVSIVLLIAAGLFARAVYDVSSRDFGFAIRDVTVISFEAPPRGYDAARTRAVARQLAESMAAPPLGRSVALTSTEPLGSGNIKGAFRVPGVLEEQNNAAYEVSPSYFSLLGLKVVAGRALEPDDTNRPVVVIGESMARRYWTIPRSIGQRIFVDPATGGWNTPGELEVVGVVADIPQTNLDASESVIYHPLSGRVLPRVLVRDPGGQTATIKEAAARIDPRLRMRSRSLAANLGVQTSATRTGALLAGTLGGLALVLAMVGLLGVFSYWVQQRTREIGIHMALGARGGQVVRLVLASSARTLAAGAACGIVGGALASQLLRNYLFGLSTLDPIAYLAVLLLVTAAGAIASYWPARRASRVDPVVALRCE